jgi:uncharacterized protein
LDVIISDQIPKEISDELKIPFEKVIATVNLLLEDNTIPFIARYRKEKTGNLNEVDIRAIKHLNDRLTALNELKEQVITAIREQEKLTPELESIIRSAKSAAAVEDIYLPFKRKRKTKADIARENGLEPLAEKILKLEDISIDEVNDQFVSEKFSDALTAFQGAVEIIADNVGHDLDTKELVKEEYNVSSLEVKLVDEGTKNEEKAHVYKDYFTHKEDLLKIAPHRVLAINRGEKEGILKLKIEIPDKTKLLDEIKTRFRPEKETSSSLETYFNRGIDLAYTKFLAPSIKAEQWREVKKNAFENAIDVFTKNLESLLLTPPIGGHTILGLDPAFRTGCKLAIVNPQGGLLYTDTLYFHTPNRQGEAISKFNELLDDYPITLISIGDGTASRETEEIISQSEKRQLKKLPYLIVSESGASVYSASEVAAREFPDLDVSLRGTISICRRVQDPLAEYVKIDPWSIGIGQYQHDLPQKELREALTETVESVVNRIGVNVNTASPELLSYIAGIKKSQTKKIFEYAQNSLIKSREEILKIKGIGPKTFEQAAGFLRIPEASTNPLDATGIHPESYPIAKEILQKLNFPLASLNDSQRRKQLKSQLNNLNSEKLRKSLSCDVGEYTFQDILDGLKAPFRDPRSKVDKPILRKTVLDMDTLEIGVELEGTVRNVTSFGAFIDIGLKHSGLVHISELANYFVKDPFEVVTPGDRVNVKVISLDKARNRIGLSMKQVGKQLSHKKNRNNLEPKDSEKEKNQIKHRKLSKGLVQTGKKGKKEKISFEDLKKRFG